MLIKLDKKGTIHFYNQNREIDYKGLITFIKSEYVYTPWTLFCRLKFKKKTQLSLDEIKGIFNVLSKHNKSGTISNSDHVQNIKNRQADIQNNICPRCQGALVVRNGKNGKFIGCSNYPKCKFTKQI